MKWGLGLCMLLMWTVGVVGSVRAQAPSIRVTGHLDRWTFHCEQEIQEWRIEVFDPNGSKRFDSGLVTQSSVDWVTSKDENQVLLDGTYRYLVTLKEASGKVSEMLLGQISFNSGADGAKQQSAEAPGSIFRMQHGGPSSNAQPPILQLRTPLLGVTAGPGLTGGGTNGVVTLAVAPGGIQQSMIAGGQMVKSINGLFDNVTLTAGSNITLTPSGNSLSIADSGGGLTLPYSASVFSSSVPLFSVTNTTGNGAGVFGRSGSGRGVYGSSNSNIGLWDTRFW